MHQATPSVAPPSVAPLSVAPPAWGVSRIANIRFGQTDGLLDPAQVIPNVEKFLSEKLKGVDVPDKLKKVSASRLFELTEAELVKYKLEEVDASTLLAALWPFRGNPPNEQLQRCVH